MSLRRLSNLKEIRIIITDDIYDDGIDWIVEEVTYALLRNVFKGDFVVTTHDLSEVPNA